MSTTATLAMANLRFALKTATPSISSSSLKFAYVLPKILIAIIHTIKRACKTCLRRSWNAVISANFHLSHALLIFNFPILF